MIKTLKNYLYEPKSNIGWVHGSIACIGALICAFLTMMLFSALMFGDYAYKIVPSIILTPILITVFGLWLLFSEKAINAIKKTFFCLTILLSFIFLSIKVI